MSIKLSQNAIYMKYRTINFNNFSGISTEYVAVNSERIYLEFLTSNRQTCF